MLNPEQYLRLPYHRVFERNEDGTWSVEVLELDGVFSGGDSADEAAANLDEAMLLWIESEFEEGRSIPQPWGSRTHSGTLNLRLPRQLHERAAIRARLEGVSLNQFLLAAVARYVDEPLPSGADDPHARQRRSA